MTGQQWMTSADPAAMLRHLGFEKNDTLNRKMRLLAVGCCRSRWADFRDLVYRRAVETAESFADRACTLDDLIDAWNDASAARNGDREDRAALAAYEAAYPVWQIGGGVAGSVDALAASGVIRANILAPEMAARLVRCVFGPLPFRPMAISFCWQTANVLVLAQAIYDERAFDRLPILADALEDAGCTDADILQHCRQPGEHVRGCWVIDLLLGKS